MISPTCLVYLLVIAGLAFGWLAQSPGVCNVPQGRVRIVGEAHAARVPLRDIADSQGWGAAPVRASVLVIYPVDT